MEEARYSFNVKCLVDGFDCCFTLREDAPGKGQEMVEKALQFVKFLESQGATGLKPAAGKSSGDQAWDNLKSAREQPAVKQPGVKKGESLDIPQCHICGSNARVELIKFEKNGQQREAWKCQACQKWLR